MATKKTGTTKKAVAKKTTKKLAVYSTNKKLNAVLNEIRDDLFHISDTKAESIREVKRYKKEFPKEADYNIAQYGNMIIYYDDVRKMYDKAGYATVKKYSNDKLWETYKRQVGWVVRNTPEFNK